MTELSISIPDTDAAALHACAVSEGRSESEVAAEAIGEWLAAARHRQRVTDSAAYSMRVSRDLLNRLADA